MKNYLKGGLFAAALVMATMAVTPATAKSRFQSQEKVARQLADEINTMNPKLEHGAFIYCAKKNKCWGSAIVTGGPASISYFQIEPIYMEDMTDMMVGFIHSHPPETSPDSKTRFVYDSANRSPSVGDYEFAAATIQAGRKFQEYTLYIVGPDTNLYTYPLPSPKLYGGTTAKEMK